NNLKFYHSSAGSACGWNSSDGTGGTYGAIYYSTISSAILGTYTTSTGSHRLCNGDREPIAFGAPTTDPEYQFSASNDGNYYAPLTEYTITRKIKDKVIFAISLPVESTQYHVSSGSWYTNTREGRQSIFPVSSDGKKMAHTEFRPEQSGKNTYLVIRDND